LHGITARRVIAGHHCSRGHLVRTRSSIGARISSTIGILMMGIASGDSAAQKSAPAHIKKITYRHDRVLKVPSAFPEETGHLQIREKSMDGMPAENRISGVFASHSAGIDVNRLCGETTTKTVSFPVSERDFRES
tara:strand:+ start:14638 stop:15042 length:405 start_codon:yes stop_codon:yes gene_type:complete